MTPVFGQHSSSFELPAGGTSADQWPPLHVPRFPWMTLEASRGACGRPSASGASRSVLTDRRRPRGARPRSGELTQGARYRSRRAKLQRVSRDTLRGPGRSRSAQGGRGAARVALCWLDYAACVRWLAYRCTDRDAKAFARSRAVSTDEQFAPGGRENSDGGGGAASFELVLAHEQRASMSTSVRAWSPCIRSEPVVSDNSLILIGVMLRTPT